MRKISDRTGPEVIKLFSYSTQLSMKFFLLINIKMPTIVGILIFISRKNFMLNSAVQEKSLNWLYLIFHRQNKFHSQLSWAWKTFYNLWPCSIRNLSDLSDKKVIWLDCYVFFMLLPGPVFPIIPAMSRDLRPWSCFQRKQKVFPSINDLEKDVKHTKTLSTVMHVPVIYPCKFEKKLPEPSAVTRLNRKSQ